jgi:pilus assembly protein Flp/PilA
VIQFLKDEEGLTVVEYVVGAGFLVAGFSGIFIVFGELLSEHFASIFSE